MLLLHKRIRWVVAPALAAGLLVLLAGAEVAGSLDEQKILAALDSDAFRERQDQTLALLMDDAMELETLRQLLSRAQTLEQRHRLLDVARHHVLRQRREQVFDQPDRGSLGISHRTLSAEDLPENRHHGGPAIEIVITLPGFPAHGQLEPGDRVIGIDGQALPADFTAEHFREMIVNYRAGDELTVSVDRGGQVVTRTIVLASVQALGAMYDQHHLQLRPQFERDWQNARQALAGGEDEGDGGTAMPLQLGRSPVELD